MDGVKCYDSNIPRALGHGEKFVLSITNLLIGIQRRCGGIDCIFTTEINEKSYFLIATLAKTEA